MLATDRKIAGNRCSVHYAAVSLALFALSMAGLRAGEFRGNQFIGFPGLSSFERSDNTNGATCVLSSPIVRTSLGWTELIPSWNLSRVAGTLKVEARAVYPNTATPFYTLGLWSTGTNLHARKSLPDQRDEWGSVRTDTLVLKKPCDACQVRLTFSNPSEVPNLKFVSLCLSDPSARQPPLPPSRAAWGKLIPVPERSQMQYPRGDELCSPTTVSMLLAFYAQTLRRPDLDKTVPEIQAAVYDETWKGTGNWPFNTAYAGSLRGMRACVSRFSDLSELEDWIACGLPVGVSVCYNKLRGKPGEPSGHLVVCVGFTESGDPVINDPGTSRNVRKVFRRENLLAAWELSHHTVYLVYPEDASLPPDRFGHWSPVDGSPATKK